MISIHQWIFWTKMFIKVLEKITRKTQHKTSEICFQYHRTWTWTLKYDKITMTEHTISINHSQNNNLNLKFVPSQVFFCFFFLQNSESKQSITKIPSVLKLIMLLHHVRMKLLLPCIQNRCQKCQICLDLASKNHRGKSTVLTENDQF